MPAKTHLYYMPGMCAGPHIFENISLPAEKYETHWLEWKKPQKNESVTAYAKRLCTAVKHSDVVLVGVSFGGIIVQEMQKFITVRRLILISTVKTKYELPRFMRFGRRTKLYRLLPTGMARHFDKLGTLPLSKTTQKRFRLYKRYITIVDKAYLDWSVNQILNWQQEEPVPGSIHIHGDADGIFPIKNIKDCIVIKDGTHMMIINRFRWFNQHLPQLIEEGFL